jgi:hypothetical protein
MGDTMTSPEPLPIDEDGNLPEARRRLGDAVAKLCDPQATMVDEAVHWLDSLYVQLRESLPGDQGQGHGVARSLPNIWLDACDLLSEIDTAVAIWEPKVVIDVSVEPPPMTVIRLRALEKRGWRPQDVRSIDQISGNLESWVGNIRQLLTPTPKWSLPNPCPACGTKQVYRKDSAGDLVRQPALQIGAMGCECMRCHHMWAPQYFQHLASVLNYPLPEGVLE